jgi:hypothetical protein
MTWFNLALAFSPDVRAQRSAPIEGRIIAVSGDHINIDIGSSDLKGGDVAVIKREGVPIGLATVVWVDIGHTSMRVLSTISNATFKSGDVVVFEAEQRKAAATAAAPTVVPPAPVPEPLPQASQSEPPTPEAPASTEAARAGPLTVEQAAPVMPLPEPIVVRKKIALTQAANVFHGRVRGWQLYQQVRGVNSTWYAASRLDVDGSIERLYGRPWSLAWSGNGTYRDASTPSTADDFQHPKPHVYRLMLSRKNADGGFMRMGRFFPMELPSLGYLDGIQAEKVISASVHAGAALGVRPDRITQGFASREKIGAVYGTLEKGQQRGLYYMGTLGLMHSYYYNKPDELALLYDQRSDLGPKLNFFGTSQFNFNAGAAQVHTKPRMTRANAMLNSPLTTWLSLRAGANHYEPIDVNAERDLAGGNNGYVNNGYWRYFTGSAQNMPGDISLDEDLSWTNTEGQFSQGLWRLTISRRGLPAMPNGFFSVTTYNLYNPAGPDYGNTVSCSLPFFNGDLNFDANAGFRYGPTSSLEKSFRASDVSGHVNWRINEAWMLDAGVTQTYQDEIKSFMVNAGLSYRW